MHCLGADEEDGFLSAHSGSDDFQSLPSTPSSSQEAEGRHFFALDGGSDDEPEDDGGLERIYGLLGQFHVQREALSDSDTGSGPSSADSARAWDVEELFDFDLHTVAEALQRGANALELTEVIEASMAAALESRLAPAAVATPAAASGRCTPVLAGSISTRMTPVGSGRATPSPRAGPPEGPGSPRELAARLEAAALRARRTSALRPQLAEALGAAAKVLRRRTKAIVAKVEATRLTAGKHEDQASRAAARLRRSVATAGRCRRQSLLRAAEVLELAAGQLEQPEQLPEVESAVEGSLHEAVSDGLDFGLPAGPMENRGSRMSCSGQHDRQQLVKQLFVVQKAVEGAWRTHRQSIAYAVEQAASDPLAEGVGSRLQQVVSAAYARHQAPAEDIEDLDGDFGPVRMKQHRNRRLPPWHYGNC